MTILSLCEIPQKQDFRVFGQITELRSYPIIGIEQHQMIERTVLEINHLYSTHAPKVHLKTQKNRDTSAK